MTVAELQCCQLILKRVQAAASGGYCLVFHEALASFLTSKMLLLLLQ